MVIQHSLQDCGGISLRFLHGFLSSCEDINESSVLPVYNLLSYIEKLSPVHGLLSHIHSKTGHSLHSGRSSVGTTG